MKLTGTDNLSESLLATGILGGTFDPIHIGHLRMALAAASEFALPEVWLMPNGSPPHKNDRLITAKPSERLAMTQLAIDDVTERMGGKCPLVLCDYEIRRRRTSYSYETMEHFRQMYPDRAFYFIIGADSLMDLTKWVKPERLVKTCVVLAAVRGGDDESDLLERIAQYQSTLPGCDIRLMHMPAVDVSSTEIRRRLREGEEISGMVTDKVEAYIREHPSIYSPVSTDIG